MRTTYEVAAVGSCPVDESVLDVYEVVVAVEGMIPVERILAAIRDLTRAPIFQEEFTRALSERLGGSVTVTTTGYHSGVRTVCEA